MTEEKKQQVLMLGRLGWSLRRIEKQTGVRRETAAAYLKAAGIALRPPGAWGKRAPPKPANEVTTDPGAGTPIEQTAKPANTVTTDSTGSASACEPYREFIEQGLLVGRNAMSIWQELVDRHGFTGAYETVKRFVRKQRGTQTPEARAVILTAPGEEAQVDYGTGPQVRDPKTGKYRRTRLFVLTLGFSRKCIRLLSFQSSSQIWAELHETAFRRLGGTTKYIVLDLPHRRRHRPRHLRSNNQSPLPRHARPLQRGSHALPRPRSGPQGKGGTRRRPRQANAAERKAF